MNILLVDDDEDEYILVREMLARLPGTSAGKTVLRWAADVNRALAACAEASFDVCLVDYYLGAETGLDVMRTLEAGGYVMPFILMTGQGSYEMDLHAMQQGAADYLLKDQLNEHILERSIRYAIERHGAQAELERRVEERTRELEEKNRALQAEILRRTEAEQALRQAAEELELRVNDRTADLLAANRRLQTVISSLPVSLVMVDRDGYIIESNQAFLRLWEPGEPPLRRLEDWSIFQVVVPDTGLPLHEKDWPLIRAIKEGKATSGLVVDIVTGSGKEKTILISAAPIYDLGGEIAGGISISQDITLQRKLEQESRIAAQDALRRAEELEGLHKATAALLSTLDMNDLLGQILDAAQVAIPSAQKSVLHLVMDWATDLTGREWGDLIDERIQRVKQLDDPSYPALALRNRQPVLATKVDDQDMAGYGQEDSGSISSLIVAPLVFGSEVFGTLSLISSSLGVFNQDDLHLLASFAATTTAVLQNARLHAEVKHLAVTDPLTDQLNRRAFFEIGQREIERFLRTGHPLAAIMMDMDHFKQVNDLHGHRTGDQVLQILAGRLRRIIRETDLLGRYGGDEFALLMPDTSLEAAERTAHRICEEIGHTPWMTGAGPLSISISVGIAAAQRRHRRLEDLLADADQALYSAKASGRNRVEIKVHEASSPLSEPPE